MKTFRNYDELEAVELWAADNDLIDSEQALSALFDEEIAPKVIAQYGEDDEVAMNEAFCSWTESLCDDDRLHPLQDSSYVYVGKYA